MCIYRYKFGRLSQWIYFALENTQPPKRKLADSADDIDIVNHPDSYDSADKPINDEDTNNSVN